MLTTITVAITTFSAFFLTFYATWNYRKADIYEMQDLSRDSILYSVTEHVIIYMIAYILMLVIFGYSIILPTP